VLHPVTAGDYLDIRQGMLCMSEKPYNVLFLCTGNSARSIMAEAILNHLAPEKFTAYSAGSHPKGTVNPYALDVLRHFQVPIEGLRSKSWEEFTGPDAQPIDFIFTLCDDAATTPCPVWPGRPTTEHWGLPDPAAVKGNDEIIRHAFVETLRMLRQRLDSFTQLPPAALNRLLAQQQPTAREQAAEPPGPQ
jgi:protein-tyrosine-phosphatase